MKQLATACRIAMTLRPFVFIEFVSLARGAFLACKLPTFQLLFQHILLSAEGEEALEGEWSQLQ